jgi:hypothetical protein
LLSTQLASGSSAGCSTAPTAQSVVRTADTAVRGSRSRLPRITKLGDNVYVYEALHPNYKNFSVNSLVVVTHRRRADCRRAANAGDGHAEMATVAKITPQPISMVISAIHRPCRSNGAFPSSVSSSCTFSKATLGR